MKKRIVLVTGVFDLLHAEHVRFLAAAKGQVKSEKLKVQNLKENYLIVGVESDKRVRELKGKNRPIISEDDRLELVQAIKFVDEAFIVRCETHDILECYKKLLLEIKPDVYAVSENSPHLENKKKICRETGVELKVVYEENPEVSTTKIIDRIATSPSADGSSQ